MRSQWGNPVATATELQGHYVQGRDKLVPPSKFGPVCKLLWPFKTAAHLAAIGKKDERTAKRWLSGEYDPPADVAMAVFAEILKRE
jgi:hypothetical protein